MRGLAEVTTLFSGVVLGPELVTNGDFASGVGWTAVAGGVIAAGVLTITAGSGYTYRTDVPMIAGATYRVTFTISGYISGNIRGYLNATPVLGPLATANGAYSADIVAGSTSGECGLNSSSAFTGVIDNFSIKRVLG